MAVIGLANETNRLAKGYQVEVDPAFQDGGRSVVSGDSTHPRADHQYQDGHGKRPLRRRAQRPRQSGRGGQAQGAAE